MALTDLNLQPVYNHSTCPNLITGLYEPLLAEAVRYDRTTYTFTAQALSAAAVGTVGLIRNGGRIRLICDHTVSREVLQAIRDGLDPAHALQQTVSREDILLAEADDLSKDHLELATWLVAQGILNIKVAIREENIFHSKSGIIEDADGNRVAFNGSLNETLAGWNHNWESIHVYTEQGSLSHLNNVEEEFQMLWDNRASGLIVIDIPAYYRDYILERAPRQDPALIRREAKEYWQSICQALREDPDSTVATIPATLWPHQERFQQQYVTSGDRVRLLIADEVGLGKTIQAGILLKTRLNQERAQRALIICPKAAAKQWQSELLMKFDIDVPIIDRYGATYRDGRSEPAPNPSWQTPLAIAGQQWLVRNAARFLETCGQYDILVCDEAHRARFREVTNEARRQPNQYLRLLRQLASRTDDLLLLTATPMQMHEAELWALLQLLDPDGWTTAQYSRFYRNGNPDLEEWKSCRELWRQTNPPPTNDPILDSDNPVFLKRRLSDPAERNRTMAIMKQSAPGHMLMSRHTRQLLREYREKGLLDAPVPKRNARDIPIAMTPAERDLYKDIKPLIQQCYSNRDINRMALGFITTVFRKRLGSSAYAYAQTLRNAANRITGQDTEDWDTLLDDTDLDEITDADTRRLSEAANLDVLRQAAQQAENIACHDSKRQKLHTIINDLHQQGHHHILLFTQFRDTQEWLARWLKERHHYIEQLHGQDKELGDRTKRLETFQDQSHGLLLCTETASESLNLQFCTAVINYDIPWNPMTLEQRAGRIDRIGQERQVVDVVNLFYIGTVEYDAYQAVARRFADIENNVGEYPPIIANAIQNIIRDDKDADAELDHIVANQNFDLNQLNSLWESSNRPLDPRITMADLERPLRETELMPVGWKVESAGGRHWDITDPAGQTRRVTTDPIAYAQADGALQWWRPPCSN